MQRDIRKILPACGFDTELSIISLKENDINTIEKIVNQKKTLLSKSVLYNENETFEFKPGHRSLILSLPKRFEAYLEFKKSNQQQANTQRLNKKPENINPKNKSNDQLISELIEKLMKYMQKWHYSVVFTKNDVSNFNKDQNVCKCKIKCPFCAKFYVCSYSKHWAVSNFEAHIKKHINDASGIQKHSQTSQSQSRSQSNEILDEI